MKKTASVIALALFSAVAYAAFPSFVSAPDTPGVSADVVGSKLIVHCLGANGAETSQAIEVVYDSGSGSLYFQLRPATNGPNCTFSRNSHNVPIVLDQNGVALNP